MTYVLRDYQVSAVDRTREALRAGNRAPLLVAPTGSGKTVIASHIIERATARQSRTLFLAHRDELIQQCSAKLTENVVAHGIIKAGYPETPHLPVQVGSIQTYDRRAHRLAHGYDLLVIDEAHHAAAASYRRAIEANPGAVRLGLTATPYRADGRGLKGAFDVLIEVESVQGLTDRAYLCPSRVYEGPKLNLTRVHTVAGDYDQGEADEVVNRAELIGRLVSNYTRLAYQKTCVVFANSVAHSRAIAEAFQAVGYPWAHLDGETPGDERLSILARLASGELWGVSNCGVLTEGYDCPSLAVIIFARPTKSRGLWRQMAGRGLRVFPGKPYCQYLDFANVTRNHGFVTDPDRITLEEGIKGTQPTSRWKCKACGAVLNSRPRVCPACGMDHSQQQGEQGDLFPALDDGYELIEVDPKTYERPKAKLVVPSDALYFRFLAIARQKHYKPSWAAVMFHARTGHWPARHLTQRAEAQRVSA